MGERHGFIGCAVNDERRRRDPNGPGLVETTTPRTATVGFSPPTVELVGPRSDTYALSGPSSILTVDSRKVKLLAACYAPRDALTRSEERRVGKEGRSRWSP